MASGGTYYTVSRMVRQKPGLEQLFPNLGMVVGRDFQEVAKWIRKVDGDRLLVILNVLWAKRRGEQAA